MRKSVNSRHHREGLELYQQIEGIILDYLTGDKERDIKKILNHVKNNKTIHWEDSMEIVVVSMISIRLQQIHSKIEIDRLTHENAQLVNNVLLATTELDIIYARKGVLTVSKTGIIESANEHMLQISGYSREELVGQSITIMSSGLHSEEFWRDFYTTINARKVWEGDIINKAKDGTIITFSTTVIPKLDNSGFKVIRRDITEVKKTEETLAAIRNNRVDSLTNLPTSRQMYIDYIEKLPKRLSVMHLNDLKDINRAYGEDIGSKVLQKIANLIRKFISDYSELGIHVYKLSGPDFAIAYDVHRDQEFFDEIYNKMSTIHLQHFGVILDSGKELTIQPSFSFGVALEGSDINSFLINALSALTVSRGHSNELTIYEKHLNTKTIAIETIEMKLKIKNAFASDGFVLDFQPIVEVLSFWHIRKLFKGLFHKKDKDYLKYEVLVRMKDPQDQNKRISPAAFLPIIEADNQNIQLTTRVIKLACEFMLDNPGHYSINITAEDLNMVGRSRMIVEQIEKYGLNLSRFTFEILENIEFLTPVALDNINFFYKKGALIAIDDYGTGFSSVPRLRRLHAHFLKLDMSLTRGIDTSPDNRADVRSAIKTAHKMKAEVIAEGVETEAERRTLIELGIDHLQGYLTGRPMPHI